MLRKRFEPFMDLDDGVSVANGGNSPTPDGSENLEDDNNGELGEEEADEPTEDSASETEENPTEPQEDITQTQVFSKRLNEVRAKDLQRIAELEEIARQKEAADNQFSRLRTALSPFGYDGDNMEALADVLEAEQRQMTPEAIRAEREAQTELLNKAIESHPLIQQARKIQEQQDIAMANMQIEKDLRDIQSLNPNIKSIEDLAKSPNVDMILALVKSGSTYSQAYKRVHGLTHTTPNVADSKAHLQGIGGSGSGGNAELVAIPKDEILAWQSAFPDCTAKELKAKYNNSLNR